VGTAPWSHEEVQPAAGRCYNVDMNAARALLLAAAIGLSACSRPEPPTVTPVSGRVTSISPSGIALSATLEADNPNSVDIEIKSLSATVMLDGKYNVGTVTIPHAITLPAKKKKKFDVPISVPWGNVAEIAPLALENRDVPYAVKGTVKGGAEGIELEMPFTSNGMVTRQQIHQAVGSAIPKGIPLPF
jgi:LEA14-like dessication related protein